MFTPRITNVHLNRKGAFHVKSSEPFNPKSQIFFKFGPLIDTIEMYLCVKFELIYNLTVQKLFDFLFRLYFCVKGLFTFWPTQNLWPLFGHKTRTNSSNYLKICTLSNFGVLNSKIKLKKHPKQQKKL